MSLFGWISENNILPKKKKYIEGVSSNTYINLKAAILDEKARLKREGRTKLNVERDPLEGKNKGIEKRIKKDVEQLRQKEQKKDSKIILKNKSVLYDKLMNSDLDEFKEVYKNSMVDFERKQWERMENPEVYYEEDNRSLLQDNQLENDEMVSYDMRREKARLEWENEMRLELLEDEMKAEKLRFVDELSKQTEQARRKVQNIRKKRKMQSKLRILKIKARAKRKNETTTNQTEQEELSSGSN